MCPVQEYRYRFQATDDIQRTHHNPDVYKRQLLNVLNLPIYRCFTHFRQHSVCRFKMTATDVYKRQLLMLTLTVK